MESWLLDPHDNEHLRWKVLGRTPVYTSRWVSLYHDSVQLPDGQIIPDYHVIEFPRPAVGVIPVRADGQVMLVDHDRFISNERSWEIPSGGIEPDEDWETAARREMLEESGCSGGELIFLGSYRPSIGSTNQQFGLYLARGVEQTSPISDTNEIIAARWFDIATVRQIITAHRMPDGLSLMAFMQAFYQGYLK